MSKRFSKSKMLSFLDGMMQSLEATHGFKRGDGYSVVKNAHLERALAFGKYDCVRDLIEEIEGGYIG